jgi:hypothetical protein
MYRRARKFCIGAETEFLLTLQLLVGSRREVPNAIRLESR